MLKKGDKVKGCLSDKYLGEVIRTYRDQVIIRGPDGAVFSMSDLLVELVPPFIEGKKERIWVGS